MTRRLQLQQGVLEFSSRSILYVIHRRKRRTLRISVSPDLSVEIFAPSKAPIDWIEEVVAKRAEWIVRTLDKVAACHVLSLPKELMNGQPVFLLGREYRVTTVRGSNASIEVLFDRLVVTHRRPEDSLAVGRLVRRWYREQASNLFESAIRSCLTSESLQHIRKPPLAIRNMKSRWGSCSSSGRITLNLKLVMVPRPCVAYVVAHELCHLVHHDHSKRFYRLLADVMPDWRERKRELDMYRMK